jgi:hypothetical protein
VRRSKEMRTIEVSGFVSKVAEIDEVRIKRTAARNGKNKGIVMTVATLVR